MCTYNFGLMYWFYMIYKCITLFTLMCNSVCIFFNTLNICLFHHNVLLFFFFCKYIAKEILGWDWGRFIFFYLVRKIPFYTPLTILRYQWRTRGFIWMRGGNPNGWVYINIVMYKTKNDYMYTSITSNFFFLLANVSIHHILL